jgi:hypothetical protein
LLGSPDLTAGVYLYGGSMDALRQPFAMVVMA